MRLGVCETGWGVLDLQVQVRLVRVAVVPDCCERLTLTKRITAPEDRHAALLDVGPATT